MLLVRRANQHDKLRLSELWALVEPEMEKSVLAKKTQLDIAIELEDQKAFLAFWKDEMIGYVSFHDWQDCVEIMTVFVKEGHRRKGIAAYMTKAVYHFLKMNTNKRIVVMPNNYSKPIFEQLGMSPLNKALMSPNMRQACHGCVEDCQFPNCHCNYLEMMSHEIKIETFDYFDDNHPLYDQFRYLYQQTWRDAPWFEEWTMESVIKEFETYLDKNAIYIFATANDRLIGFATGYFVDHEQMAHKASHDQFNYLFKFQDKVFYLAEMGVLKGCRNHGLGFRLLKTLKEEAEYRGAQICLGRTKAWEAIHLLEKLGLVKSPIADGADLQRFYWISQLD